MAGNKLVTEGYRHGQGSAARAIPHHMNNAVSANASTVAAIFRGYLSMVGEVAGQPEEYPEVGVLRSRR